MTGRSELADLLPKLAGARVAVVGDVMLDRYVYGSAERLSPEAPVPVLIVERQQAMLGGAGNVARNLAALGATAQFVSVVGNDEAGREISALFGNLPETAVHLISDPDRPTSIKTRYIAGAQQLLRADRERADPLSPHREQDLLRAAKAALADCAVLVLSDYGKGALTRSVVDELIAAARAAGKRVLVDPKGSDYGRYRGAGIVTPNRKELAEAAQLPTDSDARVEAAARKIIDASGVDTVLATRGAQGMTLIERSKPVRHFAAEAREVFDVSGAGDTVIATLAACLAAGLGLDQAVELANVAAGIVVGKAGTAVALPHEIAAALHHQDMLSAESKTLTIEQCRARVAAWRGHGQKIGFTNGVFDLLHPGHIAQLQQARRECDRLIVGLNSDASVKRLKGEGRPVQTEAARATVLGSLSAVDAVVIFGDDTPIKLIEAIRPDVLVKGGDYTIDKVVGAAFVQSYGGRVVLAEIVPGFSTTATIKKMSP
ncbi:MAG: D-glycero-beta-D-manno-heptose-7-phosphate kinase [Alphaproteobacteria bacterium]